MYLHPNVLLNNLSRDKGKMAGPKMAGPKVYFIQVPKYTTLYM